MNSEAFAAWAALYDNSLADIFVSEQKELKKVAMILSALKKEFFRIESGLQEKFVDLKRRVCDEKNDQKAATGNANEKNTVENATSIDLCTPNENSENSELPCSLNLLKPDANLARTKAPISEKVASTTFYEQKSKTIQRKKKTSSSFNTKYSPLTETSSSKKENNGNKNENRRSDEAERAPENFAYKTATVRGKAKLQLPGWSCKKCEEFYEALDLSPETKKAKMNACSKHRSRFKPIPDTPKGFWDLTFPPSPNTEFR